MPGATVPPFKVKPCTLPEPPNVPPEFTKTSPALPFTDSKLPLIVALPIIPPEFTVEVPELITVVPAVPDTSNVPPL